MGNNRENTLPETGKDAPPVPGTNVPGNTSYRTYWAAILDKIESFVSRKNLPSVSALAGENRDPFKILISTMISLRTKDAVTIAAAERLFERADNPFAMAELPAETISKIIYPAGFYQIKGRNIRETARIISEKYKGLVPREIDALTELPGVGRKTATLTVSLGFGIPAICVDTHVHRISNRFGWVETKQPEETEKELMKLLPIDFWIKINEILVLFGQSVCTPLSPRCSQCPVYSYCSRRGVAKAR